MFEPINNNHNDNNSNNKNNNSNNNRSYRQANNSSNHQNDRRQSRKRETREKREREGFSRRAASRRYGGWMRRDCLSSREGAKHAPYKLLAVGGVEELPNVPHHVLAVVALGHPAPEEPPLIHDAQLMRATARNHPDVAKRGGAPGSSRALRI